MHMFNLLKFVLYLQTYIWVDVFLIKETPKAILVVFDGKEIWLPKAWVIRVKRSKASRAISIKISEYNWAKKAYR